ncbi:MAG: hypothetical protein H6831_06785 [Planctomycetes bacterium]|nr:hypothetical protein [Planctomycetota bacterium]
MTRTLRCAALLVFTFLGASADARQATEPTTDVAELIERVGDLQSFRATYRVESSDGREGLMHWTYVADDRARATLEAAGQTRDLFWIDGGALSTTVLDRDGDPQAVGMDVGGELEAYETANDLLDEHFPSKTAPPFEPHLQFSIVLNDDTDKVDVSVGIVDRRSCLLGWLPAFEARDAAESKDPECLRFDYGDHSYEVSALNGFVTRGWIGKGADERLAIELVSLELDVEIDAGEMQAPDWSDADDELASGFRHAMLNTLRQNCRETVAMRIAKLHSDGALEWPEGGPEGLTEVLTELHTVATRHDTAAMLERFESQLATRTEALTAWADEVREDPRMPEELEKLKQQARGELEHSLEQIVETTVERLGPPTAREFDLAEEFLEVERAALRAVLEETVRDAVLARYDETVGAVE